MKSQPRHNGSHATGCVKVEQISDWFSANFVTRQSAPDRISQSRTCQSATIHVIDSSRKASACLLLGKHDRSRGKAVYTVPMSLEICLGLHDVRSKGYAESDRKQTHGKLKKRKVGGIRYEARSRGRTSPNSLAF